ncbi:YbfB/YjiJ family MFS transporter [Paenibacillus albiflavus]|uniref:YbfB/YjiJ family MFS transporter n=1 Tax=Paenibacillus albiflavus TaxID=2545760 RepID=A0A4R4EJ91_9BACL|nr:YbfB/YjiJ family MFS transporter [Paenibacillus albiflavus]
MRSQTIRTLIGGILSLFIAMGIGRFAYTVVLPFMQEAYQFSDATAGYLATSNYLGYFVGAIVAAKLNMEKKRILYLRIVLLLSIGTTALMGLTGVFSIWYFLRFISGALSAFVFVLASSIVLDQLAREGKSHLSGILYAGVGLGIMISSIIVAPLHQLTSSDGTWIGLALLAFILMIFVWFFIRPSRSSFRAEVQSTPVIHNLPTPPKKWIPWLAIAYSLEGLGYIVTGTFIVLIAQTSSSFHGDATMVWMIVGIVAAPSCIIWSKIAQKLGYVKSLIVSMVVQAIGILLPAIAESSVFIYASAILFGFTFMGITTVTTTLIRQMVPMNSSRIIGFFTTGYAFGQMLGPSLAGILANLTSSYRLALIGAAVVVFIGGLCLISGLKYESKYKTNNISWGN